MSQSLFKSLKGSKIGEELVEYLKVLEGEIYDSRNWEEGFDKKSATLAAKPIRKLIINITVQSEPKDVEVNSCE